MPHEARDNRNGEIVVIEQFKGTISFFAELNTLDSHGSLAPSVGMRHLFLTRTNALQAVKCLLNSTTMGKRFGGLVMTDRTGQHLGNYRLVHLLGQGGFAEVYLGEHLQLGTQVAIKILQTQVANEEVEIFRREARTLAHLVHPHIVRVFDFGVEGTTPFLVMDYAPNGTLRKRHPKGVPLALPTIVGYVKQIADALQYAHDEHLIHRDVKPENLLLGRRNEVLLGDFGIALLAQSSRSQSIQDVAGTA